MSSQRKAFVVTLAVLAGGAAYAQVPDVLNALDSGGRAMGVGGGLYGTGADTHSVLGNPAGLAFMDGAQVEITLRNLPRSVTFARTNFRNPDLNTTGKAGHMTVGHLAYVQRIGPSKATFGMSYNVAGYVSDERYGLGDLAIDAGSAARNYAEKTKAKIDLYTVSIGKPLNSTTTIGAGIVFANSFVRNRQSYTLFSNGVETPTTPSDLSGTGSGLGAVLGVQHIPASNKNMVVGLSVRTPIRLKNDNGTGAILDRIPGVIDASMAVRRTGMGGGNDYAVISGHVNRSFRGGGAGLLARKGTFGGGFGLEYNKDMGDFRLPIRIGYEMNPSGGSYWRDRNLLTFGVGYRPLSSDTWFDLAFGYASSGGVDTAFSVTRRMK